MNMTDTREQMMFYLEIQTSGKPGKHLAFCTKVCSGFYLVNSPLVLYFFGLYARYVKFCVLYYMGKMEYQRQR